MLTALLASALAHPMGGVYPAHDLKVVVGEDSIRVVSTVLYPLHDLAVEMRAEGEDGIRDRKLDELRRGIHLKVDGADATLTKVGATVDAGDRLVEFKQEFDAPIGATLAFRDSNLMDQTAFYRNTVLVDGPWVVESVSPEHLDRWRMEEPMRELTITLRPAPFWVRWNRPEGPIPASEAMNAEPPAALVGGGVVLLVAAGGAFALMRRPGAATPAR